eukprot:15444916-Alexandrium_andersonii.AAC.1
MSMLYTAQKRPVSPRTAKNYLTVPATERCCFRQRWWCVAWGDFRMWIAELCEFASMLVVCWVPGLCRRQARVVLHRIVDVCGRVLPCARVCDVEPMAAFR